MQIIENIVHRYFKRAYCQLFLLKDINLPMWIDHVVFIEQVKGLFENPIISCNKEEEEAIFENQRKPGERKPTSRE